MENHYFDAAGIYTGSAPANPGSTAPQNALRLAPPARSGHWPVLNSAGDGWELREDHRGDEGFINGVPARVESLGPLPPGWSGAPPAGPERYFLTRTGAYHRASCHCVGAAGEWLALADIAGRNPSARPCGRCRPPAAGGGA